MLTEIRASDLRFSREETRKLLERMGVDEFSTAEVAALDERTEGWVASLQMAVLVLQGRNDPGAFLQAFVGSHVYVADNLKVRGSPLAAPEHASSSL